MDVTVVGNPDFLIFDNGNYRIRDSKLSLRIDDDHHPEVLLQVQAYGWLYEKVCGKAPNALEVHSGTGTVVPVAYDGGVVAVAELLRILVLKNLAAQPYEPVGWSKCGGCGFNDLCRNAALDTCDIALIPSVDQSLARALHADGIASRKDLLDGFDPVTLSQYKRPWGDRMVRVGKAAERILMEAIVLEDDQEKVLAEPTVPPSANYVMFDLEGMPPNEIDKVYLWGMQVFGDKPSKFTAAVSGFGPDGDRTRLPTVPVLAEHEGNSTHARLRGVGG